MRLNEVEDLFLSRSQFDHKVHVFLYSYCDYIQGFGSGKKKFDHNSLPDPAQLCWVESGRLSKIGSLVSMTMKGFDLRSFCLLALLTAPAMANAEVYLVVGSFNDGVRAERARQDITEKLAVEAVITPAEVSGITWYRVMFPERQNSAQVQGKLTSMNIETWRINVDEQRLTDRHIAQPEAQAIRRGDKGSILVAEFADVSSALELERRLVELGVPVFGQAVLQTGAVVHQVWIGPVGENEKVIGQLSAKGLAAMATQLLQVGVPEPAAVTVPPAPEKPATPTSVNPPSTPTFNPAQLPAKPSTP